MIKELVLKNRSCRRFYQDEKITVETLKELVNLARLSASSSNLQPLKYVISNTKDNNEKIFKTLGWAGYLKDWNGPEEGEKPTGYVVILNDTSISKSPWNSSSNYFTRSCRKRIWWMYAGKCE